ncbi:hypothetical protein K488DRAFT_51309 [Vararia minispora EC-137]|uniref:Uncharacterized protein n=1 Tax=Vararia minispora EC-137 TaxID=1314806 RepID=A0ACB8QKF3_9AGAM|nr:hypothetical protein K488DRAFT_51309 [Vararia minispora EC-137]
MPNETTIMPPGGQFPVSVFSDTPLLALRCQPALAPFLPEDATTAEVVVDVLQVYVQYPDALPVSLDGGQGAALDVTVSVNGTQLASGSVALNGSASLPASLSGLAPRPEPYNLTCTGTLGSQTFSGSANMSYLPSPPSNIGSVTKRDLRNGGLLAKKIGGDYEYVLPVGFYTQWGGYLEDNDTTVQALAEQGHVQVHPIPPFENRTALNSTLAKMEEQNLWLMYDMRFTYMNLTTIHSEVTPLTPLSNLLLYYTADEPDGTSDPPSSAAAAYTVLRTLDPYHPASLVLNCADYHWADYASSADILLQDVYNLGNNLTFSSVWHTPCTPDQGVCGCDDCVGGWGDIRDRVAAFKERMVVLGWERSKSVWTVPQGFGSTEYWDRTPSGAEWLVEALVALNAGATGVVSWADPTTPSIKSAAATLARSAPALAQRMFSPTAARAQRTTAGGIDVGLWNDSSTGEVLLIAANLNYASANVSLDELFGAPGSSARVENVSMVMDGGARVVGNDVSFDSVESGAWIMRLAGNGTGSDGQTSAAIGADWDMVFLWVVVATIVGSAPTL